ncbi:hypothetical protein AC628_07100 [Bradyrhizobium sp. NAS96.2]|nr:hypothetical protein AC628_07100 [Bradyrhizobium sp. NAS96.2]
MNKAAFKIRGAPNWPPCRACGKGMATIKHNADDDGREWCVFECFNCGYTETSEPAAHGR